ncbi:hypothetical protein BKA62DRAFT_686306 [Auriculariales sp. MPI-PUGE-AT-0066]|nr:hypothetical protein BKA62DRAFT_686306 [Auriculariales sp. MPI-PUGE-AT-0066]
MTTATVTFSIVLRKLQDLTRSDQDVIKLVIPRQDLGHYCLKPLKWFTLVAHGIARTTGTFYCRTESGFSPILDTDLDLAVDGLAAEYEYRLNSDPGSMPINLANIRTKRGPSSASSHLASRAPGEDDAREQRDDKTCVFTGSLFCTWSHIIPFRVQTKGRWSQLADMVCGDPFANINSAHNIFSLHPVLHTALDNHHCAILPIRDDLPNTPENGDVPRSELEPETSSSFWPEWWTEAYRPPAGYIWQIIPQTVERLNSKMMPALNQLCPHNTRARFKENMQLPDRRLLLHAYAGCMLKTYGSNLNFLTDDSTQPLLRPDDSDDGETASPSPDGPTDETYIPGCKAAAMISRRPAPDDPDDDARRNPKRQCREQQGKSTKSSSHVRGRDRGRENDAYEGKASTSQLQNTRMTMQRRDTREPIEKIFDLFWGNRIAQEMQALENAERVRLNSAVTQWQDGVFSANQHLVPEP